ncbi:SDR family NAD(P)-dependent oxidoreductase [Paractinoplanes brasiliensis]|uniref:NAD(P)-dependent dehydrogenase (Short-subunit alcohol dehydrogenase family) n=1 Tax=Paractinoplanes brasiliensis TaxID=52695 RepID=A0A4R6JMJ7_9ACTN|nr:SDR family NAD(P)-dependent oxidoreductase [Actinoplanes brasiliensis]TDO37540.1 NAD(P)-dependent dehydrogenase (short-subunit alcohol dehydrogenase family) [Actinoplanes brasiliensis]GID31892.1 oxidoreductase [Actinoplanes brasiliensis]
MTAPTAADVLAGIDLTGRTAVVTGGASGIGQAAARALAAAGVHVIVPARRPRPDAVLDVRPMDLTDPASIRAFAATVSRADIVIGSAAVMACPETRVGPGWEAQFATNHLGHYALVMHLWPALLAAGGARVVMVGSGRSPDERIRWDDVHFTRGYDKWAAYGQSKLANILFAHQLDRLGAPSGVRAFSATPGWVLSPLQRHLTKAEMVEAGWIDEDGNARPGLFRTAEQGAATPLWAAVTPVTRGGAFCRDLALTEEYPSDAPEAARLWQLSAHLTGLDLPQISSIRSATELTMRDGRNG